MSIQITPKLGVAWDGPKKMTQKTILVVEDEKSLRDAVVDILLLKNFLPLKARNGREGVEMALTQHPDLILLDLIMPEMDGMTALQKIREDAWGANVPVIILTNLSDSNKRKAEAMATNDRLLYIIKSDKKLHDIVRQIETMVGI